MKFKSLQANTSNGLVSLTQGSNVAFHQTTFLSTGRAVIGSNIASQPYPTLFTILDITGNTYIHAANGAAGQIVWESGGVALPTYNFRSPGTKLVLYPALGAATVDHAIGISGSTMWFSVPAGAQYFKWFEGTNSTMTLTGNVLTLGANTVWHTGTLALADYANAVYSNTNFLAKTGAVAQTVAPYVLFSGSLSGGTVNASAYFLKGVFGTSQGKILDAPEPTLNVGFSNPIWSTLAATGRCMHTDKEFTYSSTVAAYNNAGGVGVIISRIRGGIDAIGNSVVTNPPNRSNVMLEIKHDCPNNYTTPGFGGWYFSDPPPNPSSNANNQLVLYTFRALLESGRQWVWASNPVGNDGSMQWLTNPAGTGKWEDYAVLVRRGSYGAQSTIGYFYVSGGANSLFYTYIAQASSYDLTDTSNTSLGLLRVNYQLQPNNMIRLFVNGDSSLDRLYVGPGETGVFDPAYRLNITGNTYISGSNGIANWIQWSSTGLANPTIGTRSPGTRIVLHPQLTMDPQYADYAMGVAGSTFWYSVPSTATSFKWFGGANLVMQLTSNVLTVGGQTVLVNPTDYAASVYANTNYMKNANSGSLYEHLPGAVYTAYYSNTAGVGATYLHLYPYSSAQNVTSEYSQAFVRAWNGAQFTNPIIIRSANIELHTPIISDSNIVTSQNIQGLRFTSVQTPGSSPFIINSSTVNANLNADMVDGYHASDLVTTAYGNTNFLTRTGAVAQTVSPPVTFTGVTQINTLDYTTLSPVFGERHAIISELVDVLWRANDRFTCANTNAVWFDGSFDSGAAVTQNAQTVISINVAGQSGVPSIGITYPQGYFYVHFYYTSNKYSDISFRFKMNNEWSSACTTPINLATNPAFKVLQFPITNTANNGNWLQELELTVGTDTSNAVQITALNYFCTRWTNELELPFLSKYSSTPHRIYNALLFYRLSQPNYLVHNLKVDGGSSWVANSPQAGNFMVGTDTQTNAAYKFQVSGSMHATGGILTTGNITSNGIVYWNGGLGSLTAYNAGNSFQGSLAFATIGSYPIEFAINTLFKAGISTNGNFIIGTTWDDGVSVLQASGSANVTGNLAINYVNATNDVYARRYYATGGNGTVAIATASNTFCANLHADLLDGRHATDIDGNWGQLTAIGNYTDFSNTMGGRWGGAFVQGVGNAAHSGAQGGYRWRTSIGSGAYTDIVGDPSAYCMEFNIPRAASGGNGVGYMFWRQLEAGVWTAWAKLNAGYADTANGLALQVSPQIVSWSAAGVAAPTVGARSVGTKVVAYPSLSATTVDYALGIEGSTLWFSVPSIGTGFKFYNNTSVLMQVYDAGMFVNTSMDIVRGTIMRNGTSSNSNDKYQLQLGWNGSAVYNHWIHTRHSAGTYTNNDIVFWVSDGTSAGTFPANGVWSATMSYKGVETPGQFISRNTSLPPLAVSSSIVVTNLNADFVDGLDSIAFANATHANSYFASAAYANATFASAAYANSYFASASYANTNFVKWSSVANTPTANLVTQYDQYGYLKANYYNMVADWENTAAYGYVYSTNDGYFRRKTLANVRLELSFADATYANASFASAAYGNTNHLMSTGTTAQTVSPNVTFSNGVSFTSNVVFEGELCANTAFREKVVNLGTANNFDLSLGNYFRKAITSATTLTISNTPASNIAHTFMVELTNGGVGAVTWWTGNQWANATAPTLTSSGKDLLTFTIVNGSNTMGVLAAKDMK